MFLVFKFFFWVIIIVTLWHFNPVYTFLMLFMCAIWYFYHAFEQNEDDDDDDDDDKPILIRYSKQHPE